MKTNLFASLRLLKANLIATLFMYMAVTNITHAQTQNNIWSLPSKYLDHTPLIPQSLPSPGTNPALHYLVNQTATRCHNAMQDAQGNLLFFIIDDKIYDKQGYLIGELEYWFPVTGAAEICIIPDPGNCQRYYIVLGGSASYGYADVLPYWGILDLSLNSTITGNTSRLGRMLSGTYGTLNGFHELWASIDYPIPAHYNKYQGGVCFAASGLRTDNSRLLFVSNGIELFRFKITSTGMQFDYSSIPLPDAEWYGQEGMSAEMELKEFSNGNFRIAVPYVANSSAPSGTKIFAAELDQFGNVISSQQLRLSPYLPAVAKHPFLHGLEFSPNGNALWITHDAVDDVSPGLRYCIEYFDFTNPTTYFQPFTAGGLPYTDFVGFQNSQIELGQDGKLYFMATNRLANISNSDNPSSATFSDNVITGLNNSYSYLNPNIQSPYEKTHVLPDQIDGMDYTDHFFVNTACCVINRGYTKDRFTAPATATWGPGLTNNPFGSVSGTVTIQNELVIPAGVTINMYNMRFEFAPGAKVVIERGVPNVVGGGKIYMNNSVFTVDSRCDPQAMWLGVQVYGHSNQNQGTSPTATTLQGVLTIGSGGKIEHALLGATAARYNAHTTNPYIHGNIVSGYFGGIISANGATFLNNVKDVELRSYIAPNGSNNLSSFTSCNFTTNGLLRDPARWPTYHIYLAGVNGINILGNSFRNFTPNLYTYTKQGVGIYSAGAGASILRKCIGANCTTWTPNLFQELYMGIVGYNSSGLITHVDYNRFINNFHGIRLDNVHSAIVTRNEFQIYRSKTPNLTVGTFGLSLLTCTQFKVQENTFTEYNSPGISQGGNTIGIFTSDTGTDNNLIYKNTFSNIKTGCQAQGYNAPVTPSGHLPSWYPGGLQYKCNTFNNVVNSADIAVTSGQISHTQGRCSGSDPESVYLLAGNKFSHSSPTSEYDIFLNPTVQTILYNHHSDFITTPQRYNSAANVDINDCANPPGNWYFDNELSCPSKINVSGPGWDLLLMEVEEITEQIEEKQNEAASLDSESISGADESVNYLQDEIALLQEEKDELINEYIRSILSDTLAINPLETIAVLLQNEEGVSRKRQLCEVYLAKGDFGSASVVRDEILELNGYDNAVRLLDLQIAANQNFVTYLSSLNNTVADESADVIESDNGVVSILQEIANDESDPVNAGKALAYLSVALDTIFPFVIEELYFDMDVKSFSPEENMDNQSILSIYPNPSDRTMVTIQLDSSDENVDSESYVEIFSVTGQLASKKYIIKQNTSVQVDISDLATGVYFVKLFSNQQLVETKKLMIRN